MSTVKRAYLPMYTSCAEGMHMSPAARGVNIGTRMKVPGHTAHSAARILHFDTDPLCNAYLQLYTVHVFYMYFYSSQYSQWTVRQCSAFTF